MLEYSSIVVAYFDTNIKKGGTFFTYNKAIKMGKEVRNIFCPLVSLVPNVSNVYSVPISQNVPSVAIEPDA